MRWDAYRDVGCTARIYVLRCHAYRDACVAIVMPTAIMRESRCVLERYVSPRCVNIVCHSVFGSKHGTTDLLLSIASAPPYCWQKHGVLNDSCPVGNTDDCSLLSAVPFGDVGGAVAR